MGDSKSPAPVSVLFVCLGNICRSTMAEGVFQSLTRPSSSSDTKSSHPLISTIDSCGTGAYHIGSSPDSRTMATLKKNGIISYRHSARKFNPARDFEEFDYILAMDEENLDDLMVERRREVKRRGGEDKGVGRVMLFGEFGEGRRAEEIQDPYYGGDDGFTVAFEQSVRFSKGFLERLEAGELS